MKKIIIIFLIISGFYISIGNGLALNTPEINQYKKWALTNTDILIEGTKDCIGITDSYYDGGDIGSGDLLSSMIVDQYLINRLEKTIGIEVYTQDYLIYLDKNIAKSLHRNFYAHHLCHFGKELDILSGSFGSKIGRSNVLLLSSGKKVIRLPKSLPIFGGSFTGAEPSRCGPVKRDKNSFVWRCALGFESDKSGVIGTRIEEYVISINTGKILKKIKYVESV